MTRASLRFAAGAALLLGAALGSPRGAGAAEQDSAAARVTASLEKLEARAQRLARDVEAARLKAKTAPSSFAGTLAELDGLRAGLVPLLYGRPWAEARPVVERVERLGGTLSALRRRLADWPEDKPARNPRAPTGTAIISGRLRDARTGAAIDDERVEVLDSDGDYVASDWTDANGEYSVTGLAAGTYFVRTETWEHLDELYDDIVCDPDCDVTAGTPVPLSDGQVRTGIDFALMPLGAIEGTVLDGDGNPLQYASVIIYDAQGGWEDQASTGADGRYRSEGLLPGVYFAVARTEYHLDELYDGLPCEPDCEPEAGTAILVGVGSTVAGIDFSLDLAGSISGRVTDQASGEPVDDVTVRVFDSAGDPVGWAYTDDVGGYRLFDLPQGTYFARTEYAFEHQNELWNDIPCDPGCTPTTGTPIVVVQGQEHTAVDFALRRLGGISGRVTDADQGGPIPGVQVRAVDAQGGFTGWDDTDDLGHYRIGSLRQATYYVFTSSTGYLDELYDNLPCDPTCLPTSGTGVAVALDAETSGIDFGLRRAGWVTGTVTAQASGLPLDDSVIRLYRAGQTNPAAVGYAGQSGQFIIAGLLPGTYYATASSSRYLDELYRERSCPAPCDPAQGDPIAVAVAQATNGIDFTLTRLGRILGRATDTGGLPVDTQVRIYNSAGAFVGYSTVSDAGWYVVDGLAAGTYFAATSTYGANVVDELYDNHTCEPSCTVTSGNPIAVALDATTSGIDFVLRRPVFADVPVDHFAWRAVEAVYNAGITSGCATAPLRFCPDADVSRAQMSVFLLRASEGPAYVPPPAQGLFGDVPVSSPFASWIEELAHRGIASGCSANPPLFCPDAATTRAQMAPLLLVTREGTGYVPPPAVGVFQDVPATDPFARWIEELVRRRVTNGCSLNPPLYCPGAATTRAQMAVFLAATFALPLP